MPSLSHSVSTNRNAKIIDTRNERDQNDPLSTETVLQEYENSGFLVTQSLGECFANIFKKDTQIERVFWAFEGSILRIWTVLNEPNPSLEENITEAQLWFLDRFPELDCDFTVIYRFDKDFEDIKPFGSNQTFPGSNSNC